MKRQLGIRVEGLSVSIDSKPVLVGIDFSLEKGSYLVVLGPSGSGKTTLLRTIAGLLEPDKGRILVGGRDVTGSPPWERGVALVQQLPGLLPHLTIEENIVLAAEMRAGLGREAARAEAWRLAGMLGIDHILSRKPGQLSGGQLQRAAIAVALATRARILLLDEPLSHLDRPLAEQLRAELLKLHQATGVTVIHVTHDQDEALALATHLAVLIDGRMEAFGRTIDVYYKPPSRRVAAFLGHNVVEAGSLDPEFRGVFAIPPEALHLTEDGGYRGLLRGIVRERGRIIAFIDTPAGTMRAYVHPRDAESLQPGSPVRFDVDWRLAHQLS
ncbi:MAG TPA: ABC transporter ATP-binding protein [Pyrodictium delaneyi]|uniref:Molybdate/tungstate import ATP-binding protein WtpC n=1 Tax=Pyrodictium delaneyi TaxID=1273541 RepID=A0A833E8I9_9CREN|nr:ABC transporter ATP-binding protein [Pyrodictium delaneyi]